MALIKLSIRLKLVMFYIIAISAVAILDLYVQLVTYQGVQEFDIRLNRYHRIHQLRLDLGQQFQRVERQLREGTTPDESQLAFEQQSLYFSLSQLEADDHESKNVYFNLRATRRGLDAYFLLLAKGIAKREMRELGWYQDIALANRIVNYIDGYLAATLSDAMQAGAHIYQILIKRIHRIRIFTLELLGICIGIFIITGVAFSSSIAKPIHRLAEVSQHIAQGELNVPEIYTNTGDEIDILSQSFNTMSRNIKKMVQDLQEKAKLERQLREEELALREAQFINLQDQIRPHFLFNAINTIARTALFEEAHETEKLALALGTLFRYALASPEAFVTIQEEADVVEEYLKFQALRFGKRLRWVMRIQKCVRSVLIPRFTLQPLVENAVRHGIEPLEQGGMVSVDITRKSSTVFVKIKDTGKGMVVEKGCAVHEGLGISNVRKRLLLCYGDGAILRLTSKEGQGTKVLLKIPVRPKMETMIHEYHTHIDS
ncbi:sensor histidine kinase [Gracilinema caldarium]|uniref:histidine kinase n=1 Tax=Gracilinema caldarium (strain ATCC 51460 / DSM 7334 / H1) TaxID=744872 RepID=F8EZK6_GRAC1|nr:histidine kinase [Gracilinema caldarium]AEJ20730.1 integral membrane sensor signal transduction histidine kinase [Gracilinema caldarium DSM 7334]